VTRLAARSFAGDSAGGGAVAQEARRRKMITRMETLVPNTIVSFFMRKYYRESNKKTRIPLATLRPASDEFKLDKGGSMDGRLRK
jgi:hypothetical protein